MVRRPEDQFEVAREYFRHLHPPYWLAEPQFSSVVPKQFSSGF
ncbi:hypothetical protein Vi05172_g1094 [Venturia inaequalis]|nr:hypothetical protein Vi05172_g1094 [Venturia inaequalis]